ncbi:MAG: type II secretion system F family protein [Actinomycetota bacterium]
MPIYVLFAALAVSVSIPLLWWSVAADRRPSNIPTSVDDAGGSVTDARQIVMKQGAGTRVGVPALKSLGATLLTLTPVGWIASLRNNLMLAGRDSDSFALERTLVVKFFSGIAFGLVAFFPVASMIDATGLARLALTVVVGLIGFFVPDVLVARRGRERQELIQLEMPDTLDQITMSVEAGLGFEAALTRTARAGEGPLADELNRTLREIQLGIPRAQALRQLADRTDVTDLDSFVLAVVQSEQYGIPVGKVLRVQSDELRDKRRERAEERALKIPVKMIFPLVFCVFPAMFIVLLGPAAINIFRTLG